MEMHKPTLVVMAAGMGSRYGGCKQIDPVGPHGEIIMDYSIFDAKRAGFERVVFIINRRIEQDFMEVVGNRAAKHLETEIVFQELPEKLPSWFRIPEGRVKPWGTAHAIYCAKDKLHGPFAVINADDYYGIDAFRVLYEQLVKQQDDEQYHYSMVGFKLANTMTENGSVARGICCVNAEGKLTDIEERTKVAFVEGKPAYTEDEGKTWTNLPADNPVSMNMWGFSPSILEEIEGRWPQFLKETVPENPLKSEMYIPKVVGELLKEGKCTVDVLTSRDRWYGVTYKEDKPSVCAAMKALTDAGLYPDEALLR